MPSPNISGFASVPNTVSFPSSSAPPSVPPILSNSSTPPCQPADTLRFSPSSPITVALCAVSATSPLGNVSPNAASVAKSGASAARAALCSGVSCPKSALSCRCRLSPTPICAENVCGSLSSTKPPLLSVRFCALSTTSALSSAGMLTSGFACPGFRHSAASASSRLVASDSVPANAGFPPLSVIAPLRLSRVLPGSSAENSLTVQVLASVVASSRTLRSDTARMSSSAISTPIVPARSGTGGSGSSVSSRTSSYGVSSASAVASRGGSAIDAARDHRVELGLGAERHLRRAGEPRPRPVLVGHDRVGGEQQLVRRRAPPC